MRFASPIVVAAWALGSAAPAIASTGGASTTASGSFVRSPIAMAIVVVVVVGLIAYAVANLIWRRDDPLLARVGSFVSIDNQPVAPSGTDDGQLGGNALSQLVGRVGRALQPSDVRQSWQRLGGSLELADIDMPVARFVVALVVVTVVLALLLDVLLGPVLAIVVAVAAVVFGARAFTSARLRRKRRAFAEQLPDSLDVLASALRTGHSLVGALSVVADDASEPSKSEYRRVLADEQLGVPLEDALLVAARRMENDDLEQVSLVARLQREMGSNAADVLDHVIVTVRDRTELRRLVRTLTAQGRLARWILTGLPVILLIVFTLLNPGYMHPLYHKSAGHLALAAAALLIVLGSVVIGKIIDIER